MRNLISHLQYLNIIWKWNVIEILYVFLFDIKVIISTICWHLQIKTYFIISSSWRCNFVDQNYGERYYCLASDNICCQILLQTLVNKAAPPYFLYFFFYVSVAKDWLYIFFIIISYRQISILSLNKRIEIF